MTEFPGWLKSRMVYSVTPGTMSCTSLAPFDKYVSVSTFGPYTTEPAHPMPYALSEDEAWEGFWASLRAFVGGAQIVVFRRSPQHAFLIAGEVGGKWDTPAAFDRHIVTARVSVGYYTGESPITVE